MIVMMIQNRNSKLPAMYKYPLVYFRFETNHGYDPIFESPLSWLQANIVLSSAMMIPSLEDSIAELVQFLQANQCGDRVL